MVKEICTYFVQGRC